jgi:hypothetical protein
MTKVLMFFAGLLTAVLLVAFAVMSLSPHLRLVGLIGLAIVVPAAVLWWTLVVRPHGRGDRSRDRGRPDHEVREQAEERKSLHWVDRSRHVPPP